MTNNKQQTEINAVEYLDKVNQFAKENNTDKPKQQTAVEWLVKEYHLPPNSPLVQQAKEMEKEQIIKAASDHCYPTCELATIDAEQYYNETYGGGNR
jgi:hypothetical protein